MKNIHILPTDKPSRLVKQKYDTIDRLCLADIATKRAEYKRFNLYITSDEEIKEGNWFVHTSYGSTSIQKALEVSNHILDNQGMISNKEYNLKIILTTDKDLIKDGVQAIDDEFLEWFVKNPSCEEIEVYNEFFDITEKGEWLIEYKIIIPKEEPKQLFTKDFGLPQFGTKEFNDLASQCFGGKPKQETLEEAAEREYPTIHEQYQYDAFIEGAKWQQEQVLNFLYSEITERRDYSASKMCEKVIEFIKQI